jgi:hypothetical protein
MQPINGFIITTDTAATATRLLIGALGGRRALLEARDRVHGMPPFAAAVSLGLYPIVTLEKTATEYDRKTGIKWLSCTAK